MGKKRLKIAFLSAYQNSVERGAEVFVKEVVSRLKGGFDVTVVAGSVRPRRRWPLLWRVFLDPVGISILVFTIKSTGRLWRGKYDVVVPINGGWQVLILRVVSLMQGSKLVISGQSGVGWDDRVNLWAFPAAFVGLTKYASRWAKGVNRFVEVRMISNGVDTEKFNIGKRTAIADLQKPVILSVGALTNFKRLDLAIKSVAKLEMGSLLLVGKGENEDDLQKLGDELLAERFAIKSFSHNKMPSVYAFADLFTYPTSPTESFGIAMIEAMASGLPVVANDDPIRREVVGDAGLFVNPNDTDGYAKALQKALNASWGEKPRKQAEKFDWDNIAKDYEELFRSLIK